MPRRLLLLSLPLLLLALALLAWLGPHAYRYWRTRTQRFSKLGEWFDHYPTHPDWTIQGGTRCGDAPFLLPTTGYIGFLWDDSFNFRQRHQGIDIFSPDEPGVTPVVAAYSGYLTRRLDWKSTLAIRVSSDPLQPGRQIWLYYTHMALPDGISLIAAEFPPGGAEVFVEAGTVLGAQGNYSGYPGNPTGVHLHFSIVLDDGEGSLRNELDIRNTLDPSPYLGLEVNAGRAGGAVPVCAAAP
jgi:murein DD-endopeptidase MepM/ murein hydrolase activator NlpD